MGENGGCFPTMDLFWSEPMQLAQLIIPIESSHRTISYLGDLGLFQFKDLNAEKSPFQRTYATQIKRCSEMARKLRFFKEQMVKGGLLPSLRSTSGTDINLDGVEVKLGELEAELMEMNANSEKLQCAYNELLEYKLVLQKLPRSHLRQVHNEFHENALQMAGISVVGRNYYGVFPLRVTLLNVREASHKQIMENAEITSIKQILGLQHGKQYDSVKTLRYGHLMIMTNQV